MWDFVSAHFKNFRLNIALRPDEHSDARGKAERVAQCLYTAYYQGQFNPAKFFVHGSYGKNTAIRPTSDVDVLFFLPISMLEQYSSHETNGQSNLLQDIRGTLLETFPRTSIKADGQAVVVDYETRTFEVTPAFIVNDGIYIADSTDGGRWKKTYAVDEVQRIIYADRNLQNHVSDLIKYAKVWKRSKQVALKSIVLERIAFNFILQWPHLQASLESHFIPHFYHDWLVRDFFEFLLRHNSVTLQHGEVIQLGDEWKTAAREALYEATKACEYERDNQAIMAEIHWKNIFGSQFPSLPLFPASQNLADLFTQ